MHLCVQIKYIKAMNLNASKKTSELLPGTISELQGRTEPSKPGVYFIYFHTLAQSKTTMCKKKLSERKKPGISSELLKDTGMKIQTFFFLVITVTGMLWQQHQPRRFSAALQKVAPRRAIQGLSGEKTEINPVVHTHIHTWMALFPTK